MRKLAVGVVVAVTPVLFSAGVASALVRGGLPGYGAGAASTTAATASPSNLGLTATVGARMTPGSGATMKGDIAVSTPGTGTLPAVSLPTLPVPYSPPAAAASTAPGSAVPGLGSLPSLPGLDAVLRLLQGYKLPGLPGSPTMPGTASPSAVGPVPALPLPSYGVPALPALPGLPRY